jgi:hypothetical protein
MQIKRRKEESNGKTFSGRSFQMAVGGRGRISTQRQSVPEMPKEFLSPEEHLSFLLPGTGHG